MGPAHALIMLAGFRSLHRELSEGLLLQRVSCPIGVLCVIFESRPEAIVQISSLAIKSGNAIILKGGKEAMHTNSCLIGLIREALASTPDIPIDTVQYVSSRDAISELLRLDAYIDVRGLQPA
jgi:glutamate-5-semialdehyde dehydrogenase